MAASTNALRLCALLVIGEWVVASVASATPQFARRYRIDCSYCHSLPPRLNERGLGFVAAGYRFPEGAVEAGRTISLAVWNTVDAEWRHSASLSKVFPSRVELISAGSIGGSGLSYFAEWRGSVRACKPTAVCSTGRDGSRICSYARHSRPRVRSQ